MSERDTSSWRRIAYRAAKVAERGFDAARRTVGELIDPDRPVVVMPYRGYGSERRVLVHGRVMRDPGVRPARPHDSWWHNVMQTYRRMESDEVPGARVRVELNGVATTAQADEEGLFHARIELPARPTAADSPWTEARIAVDDPALAALAAEPTLAPVLIPPSRAAFGVISDMDDTIIRTNATSLWRMIRVTALRNAHTRAAFPGVGAFFRALHAGGGADANPLFYVSSSPWNLYDVLTQFLDLKGLPAGPLMLRDWGYGDRRVKSRHHAHKLSAIRDIMGTYPEMPFILVGDSGQQDPEIYRDVVHEHPGRVRAVYIRNVTPDPLRGRAIRALAEEVEEAGSALVLSNDTMGAARHAAEHGWIDDAALEEVAGGAVRDRSEGGDEAESESRSAPTVVVEK